MKVFTDGSASRRRVELLRIMTEPGNEDVIYVADSEEVIAAARMLAAGLDVSYARYRFRRAGLLYPDSQFGRLPRRRVVIEDGDVILGQPGLLITREVEILAMSLSVPAVSLADPMKPSPEPQEALRFRQENTPPGPRLSMVVELSPTDRALLTEIAQNTGIAVANPMPDGSVA